MLFSKTTALAITMLAANAKQAFASPAGGEDVIDTSNMERSDVNEMASVFHWIRGEDEDLYERDYDFELEARDADEALFQRAPLFTPTNRLSPNQLTAMARKQRSAHKVVKPKVGRKPSKAGMKAGRRGKVGRRSPKPAVGARARASKLGPSSASRKSSGRHKSSRTGLRTGRVGGNRGSRLSAGRRHKGTLNTSSSGALRKGAKKT